jgi:hypothetical protein
VAQEYTIIPPSGAFTNPFPPRTYSPHFLSVAFIQSLFYGGNLKSAGELLAGTKGLEAVGHGDLDDEVEEGMGLGQMGWLEEMLASGEE